MSEREQAALDSLAKLPKGNSVLVGGYALNAYVPPRFSVDCDLVVIRETSRVEKELKRLGFERVEAGNVTHGQFIRYESKSAGVSFGVFVDALVDNETGVVFQGKLFDKYSGERRVVGRLATGIVTMRVANPELLFATKFVPARRQDVRDMFMLSGIKLDWPLVERLITDRCTPRLIKTKVVRIQLITDADEFRDGLHGAYGRIPDETYRRCKKGLDFFLEKILSGMPARGSSRNHHVG